MRYDAVAGARQMGHSLLAACRMRAAQPVHSVQWPQGTITALRGAAKHTAQLGSSATTRAAAAAGCCSNAVTGGSRTATRGRGDGGARRPIRPSRWHALYCSGSSWRRAGGRARVSGPSSFFGFRRSSSSSPV